MYSKNLSSVINLTQDLVKINSENPNTTELEVQVFLVQFLSDLGFEIEIIEYDKDRNNIIALYPPLSEAEMFNYKYFAFSGHMDTVPGYKETRSEMAPIEDNKLYGRGSCDMKGGIASFLTAIKIFLNNFLSDINKHKFKRGICVILTSDEEMGGEGVKLLGSSKKFNNKFSVELCVLAEPTLLHPVIGHKGIIWVILDFKGKSAHASTPSSGDNAVEKAAIFINNLGTLKQALKKRSLPSFPEISPPTLNVGIIEGGRKINVVPDFCHVEIDRRLLPNETSEAALDEIKDIARNLNLTESIEFHPIKPGESYILQDGVDNLYFLELDKISKPYRKNKGQLFLNGYTEADIFNRYYNIPVIILGPGSLEHAHKKNEYVEIEQLEGAVEIYLRILEKYC